MALHSFSVSFSNPFPRAYTQRNSTFLRPPRTALAATTACQLAFHLFGYAGAAQAQSDPTSQTITVSGRSAGNAAGVAGFGDVPLYRVPFSATVISTRQLQDAGIAGLADITRLDASVTDAYNAPGYWTQLSVRGFTLDNRFNYRRDGLPVNAETVIPTDNKSALEILKGASGIQAGTSAPGGLVNLVVKRPGARLRGASVDWTQPGSVGAAADIGDRAGVDGALGWRVNASADRLDPLTRNSRGHAWLVAVAVDARLSPDSLLEAELETSRQSEPSTPGFSLLGQRLPNAADTDPRLNLNNQAWSLPVVLDGRTASLRYSHTLAADTQLVAHVMRQNLRNQDRIAFPYGVYDPNTFDCDPCDRYGSDGRFSYWDFRSENERRTSDAADLSIKGSATAAGLRHRFNAGLLLTRYQARFQRQAFNLVGTGSIDGQSQVPADPSLTDENTHRDERTTELHLQDAITLSPDWQLWAGLRHTRLHRDSVRTDGSRATAYSQAFTTPWLSLAYQLNDATMVYTSWGQGIESDVAPNRSPYTNAGEALPTLISRQLEAGIKHHSSALDASMAAFDIQRPAASDIGKCSLPLSCSWQIDGSWHHSGLEAEAEWRAGAFSLRGSALALRARREGAAAPSANGLRPTNVPAFSLKLQVAYNLAAVPGLALLGFITHEGQRMVLRDNSIATPGWTRLDLAARYSTRIGGQSTVLRLGLDNALNQRAWKEAPYQFGHTYLYPLAPRTLHASAQFSF